MGRGSGKVTLKHIQNEKVRTSAFNQRSKGLTKKVSEFSNNFEVEAFLIVYDGDGDGKPMTWPQDPRTLRSMLTKYEQQKNETTPTKFEAKDYFANKKNAVEAEILRVRKKITKNKYPTWGRCFNNLEGEQLKGFINFVDVKIQCCNERINMLKNMEQSDQTSFRENTAHMPDNVTSPQASQPVDTLKQLISINDMMDFTDVIEWDDPMSQNNVFSSHSSELDDMHNIPQMQTISAPLKSHDTINDMVDFTDVIEWDDLMPQNNGFSSYSSELDVMHSIPQMQPISTNLKSVDNISLPSTSSTNQLGEFVKLDDLMDKSDQDWASQLVDLDDWDANKLDDDDVGDGIVNWVRQPDMFEWQDISFSSEIEQQCTALDVFSQSIYGF
ncbi:unnamed protein product [Trifolium pratense]|uniref:Uncharacterized protein n=1 Tax=Trifolium pratense TaxID=57577 RepID=A0ACB0KA80_TRIPR|nr:unnamed protein product [Trifolium pratense]